MPINKLCHPATSYSAEQDPKGGYTTKKSHKQPATISFDLPETDMYSIILQI